MINGMYQCVYPFEYVNNQCICVHGYLLNITKCINILESINNLNIQANCNISNQISLFEQTIENIENQLVLIDQNYKSNVSEIENRIVSNYSKSDYNLQINTTILDNRIFSNITDIKQDIITAQIKADENLLQNTTVLDWRIFNNISLLNNTVQNLTLQLQDVNNSLLLKNEIIEQQLQQSLFIIDQDILSNISEIENRIISNYSKSDYNLLMNTSILDSRIFSNITNVQKDIIITQMKADENLLQNTTVLDWRIFNNVSQLNTTIQNVTQQVRENLTQQLQSVNNSLLLKNEIIEQQLQQQNLIIEQQKQLVDNLMQQLNCTSNYGYSIVNGSCIQVTCAISGQYSINGICQCTNINSIVQSGSCVCPPNSNVIGNVCVCSITGQMMQNGVCTCSNINSYVSGNQCVCPTYSLLVGNTCTCPSYSQIVNNECSCNIIVDQVMHNGLCQCQTTGAFVDNGTCICGQYAINISNSCTCPTNSTLVNNICICDIIIGQQMVNGSCQCPSGQSVVNNSCKQTTFVINISNIECSQEIITSSFDINDITNTINTSNNFSLGYVFSSSTVIQNAFIDISDNVYTSTVYPIFQSQNTFTNLKVQFGTQQLNSGSLIISSSSSVSVNQMNIISRSGSQLTIQTALSILTSSSTSANITNLLVNLSFAPSSGNIALINNINGVMNISGYEILGSFISTGTVAMIGINVNATTINVNQVSFQPILYNVGNSSSYFFGISIKTCTFTINNIAIILGNSSNFLLLGSIPSNSSSQYQFGGIITYAQGNSIIVVNNLVLDSYQKFSTSYVEYSGFLIGYVQSSQTSVTIKNVCLQQNMTSTTIQFLRLGFIGYISGNISIQNAYVAFSVQSAKLSNFGIISYQAGSSLNAEVINLINSVNVSSSSGNHVSSIIGISEGKIFYVKNTTVVSSNIIGSYIISGFLGSQYVTTNVSILNSTISKTNISGQTWVGGFVGHSYSTIYLINSKIQFVRLSGSDYVGVIIGLSYGSQSFTDSSSSSNYVKGVLQNDCAVLSNSWSVAGC
ncbi:Conserved_hypothetical protein [Hexamita inflata]|uniref:Uncharacterized protein n=1 Tax=Hexamita inflata TaxID=28002 RepID=A0AA86ND60_9EUKA|nr:Conserved hypothetical protein [Hexamita inflata]